MHQITKAIQENTRQITGKTVYEEITSLNASIAKIGRDMALVRHRIIMLNHAGLDTSALIHKLGRLQALSERQKVLVACLAQETTQRRHLSRTRGYSHKVAKVALSSATDTQTKVKIVSI